MSNILFEKAKEIKTRVDGWINILTGIGDRSKDKRLRSEIWWEPLTMQENAHLYMQDDIAGRICDKLPDAMTKEWIDLFLKGSDEQKEGHSAKLEKVENRFKELNARAAFNKALKYSRIFGGGAVFVITDEEDFSQPIGKFSKIIKLHPMHRFELIWASLNADLRADNFSKPEQYWLINQRAVPIAQMLIHTSRLIKFYGVEAPPFMQSHLSFWGDSVLSRMVNTIRNYQTSNDLAVSALHDYSIGVFKMRNLSNLIASGKEQQIVNRLEIANLGRSVLKSMVIDESESYDHITRSLAGVPEILSKSEDRMVSCSGYPHTVLLGDSPSGLGATGDSEQNTWYDRVKENQNNVLAPGLDYLCRLVEHEMADGTQIDYKFRSLYQVDEKKDKEKQKIQAEIDAIYVDKGIAAPEDIAESRYSSSGQWQDKTVIRSKSIEVETGEDKNSLPDPVTVQTTDPGKLTTLPYSNLNIMQGDPAYPEKKPEMFKESMAMVR